MSEGRGEFTCSGAAPSRADRLARSAALLGAGRLARLAALRVAVVGAGGVGGWCAEALVRTGVGHVVLMDDDVVVPSNLNRQDAATVATLGRPKVEALRDRLLAVAPDADVTALVRRFETADDLAALGAVDVVVDAIDSVACKAELILAATAAGIRLVSSMGAALRTDPTRVAVRAFDRVEGDGLARALRQRFRRLGRFPAAKFACVASTEPPAELPERGSAMPVVCAFGMALAAEAMGVAPAQGVHQDSRGVTMEMTLAGLVDELRRGTRVILQVRHAERPKMDPDDPSFGDALAITDEGIRTSRLLGEALRPFADGVQFYASPLRRTRMTAECIAEGMGLAAPEIPTDDLLGNGSFYYDDPAQVLDVFRPGNFFKACFDYFRTGEQRGFKNLYAATDACEEWLMARFAKRLFVVTTHDCYIAAFLYARRAVAEFTCDNWPRFLDGGAILVDPDGTRRYALVRTGLSDGICGVGGRVIRPA